MDLLEQSFASSKYPNDIDLIVMTTSDGFEVRGTKASKNVVIKVPTDLKDNCSEQIVLFEKHLVDWMQDELNIAIDY